MGSMRTFVTDGLTDGTEGILKDQTVGPKKLKQARWKGEKERETER